jgi:hypothetical protein
MTNELAARKAKQLLKKRQDVIAADDAALARRIHAAGFVQAEITKLQAKHADIQQDVAKLRAQRAIDDTALTAAEEAWIKVLARELAIEIIQHPVTDQAWITASVIKLATMIRSPIDTPNNERYSQDAVVTQALALREQIDAIDMPVFMLPGGATDATSWAVRRKQILAAAKQAA